MTVFLTPSGNDRTDWLTSSGNVREWFYDWTRVAFPIHSYSSVVLWFMISREYNKIKVSRIQKRQWAQRPITCSYRRVEDRWCIVILTTDQAVTPSKLVSLCRGELGSLRRSLKLSSLVTKFKSKGRKNLGDVLIRSCSARSYASTNAVCICVCVCSDELLTFSNILGVWNLPIERKKGILV